MQNGQSRDRSHYCKSVSDTAQVYESGSPSVDELAHNYKETLSELHPWLEQCRLNYDDRRNIWPGKQDDLRKAGADCVPWEGASDSESMVVGERINAFVSLCMFALTRAHIRAYPVEVSDVARSRIVSGFLKYMRDSYIPEFAREMELASNYLFEKGIAVTYVGWEQREVTRLQSMDLEQIGAVAPDFAEMLMDETNDDQVVAMLQSQFPKLTTRRAKKALRKLRKEGVADLPVSVKGIDRPVVQALAPALLYRPAEGTLRPLEGADDTPGTARQGRNRGMGQEMGRRGDQKSTGRRH